MRDGEAETNGPGSLSREFDDLRRELVSLREEFANLSTKLAPSGDSSAAEDTTEGLGMLVKEAVMQTAYMREIRDRMEDILKAVGGLAAGRNP